jgi:HEAT repeat protein
VKAMQKDSDTLVRWTAADAFRMIGPGAHEAAPALLELMVQKDDERMREIAAGSLHNVASPKCKELLPKLLAMLKKGIDDESIEAGVLAALGAVQTDEDVVVPLLMVVVREKNPKRSHARCSAVYALRDMGPKAEKAVPLLIECVKEGAKLKDDDPMNVYAAALQALRAIGPAAKPSLPLLKAIAEDPDVSSGVRARAVYTARIIERGPVREPDPKRQ